MTNVGKPEASNGKVVPGRLPPASAGQRGGGPPWMGAAMPATSLRLASGSEWSRVEIAAALLKSLHREYREWAEKSDVRESVLRRFAESSSWVRDKRVRIEENGSAFEGVTEGLDARGFLRVRTTRGVQTVLSGTVRER